MKVYVVSSMDRVDNSSEVIGVYSTRERAEEELKALDKKHYAMTLRDVVYFDSCGYLMQVHEVIE